jgi:hypothetical protein
VRCRSVRPESPITVVALKDIAREVAGLRSVPAVASALAWLGSGIRGILMSRIAERIGTRSTVIFVSLMIGLGLSISTFGPPAASGGTGRTEFHHPAPRHRGLLLHCVNCQPPAVGPIPLFTVRSCSYRH